jgi:hypothetical protein
MLNCSRKRGEGGEREREEGPMREREKRER